jgi:hypothetical protein
MKNLKLTTAILALTMLFSALAPSAFAIGISPLRVEIKAKPGETIEASVQAFNSKEEEQVVVLTKGDFTMNQNEDLDFYTEPNPENTHSMMDWIVLPEENTPVEARGGVEIKYTINVPENAKSQSYYGVVFVSSADPEVIDTGIGVGVVTNVAQLILLEVEGDLKTEINVDDFKIDQKENNVRFLTSVVNKGNTHDAAQGKIIIADKKLEVLEELELNKEKHNSLPGIKKTFANNWIKFPEYQKGVYYAYLDLKDENQNPFYAEIKYRINNDGKIETLGFNMGRSYQEALKTHGALPLIPIALILTAAIITAIATKFCCNKKSKK